MGHYVVCKKSLRGLRLGLGILVLSAVVALVPRFGTAGRWDKPELTVGTKINFGKFTIEIGETDDYRLVDSYEEVEVKRNGKLLRQGEGPYLSVVSGEELQDFPLSGCKSMTLEMYTGGASCCYSYYILTSCPDGDAAAFKDPDDGVLGEPPVVLGEVKAFPICDPAFVYYSRQSRKNDKPVLFLSHGGAPRPTRYVIFDDNAWRADKVGEFPQAYQALAAETKADMQADEQGYDTAPRAIALAYYTHMSGADEAEVKAVLEAELPTEFLDLRDTVFYDILIAAAEFRPFEQLPLP